MMRKQNILGMSQEKQQLEFELSTIISEFKFSQCEQAKSRWNTKIRSKTKNYQSLLPILVQVFN